MARDELGDRLRVAGVAPPLAGGFAGPRDHRGEQDEGSHGHTRCNQWSGECPKRLGDDDGIHLTRRRCGDRIGVIARTGVLVMKRKRWGQGAVPTPAQRFDRRSVDARIDSRARDQDERRHPAITGIVLSAASAAIRSAGRRCRRRTR